MSTTLKTDEGFVPYLHRYEDGDLTVFVKPDFGYEAPRILGRFLGYVLDGRIVAITEFGCAGEDVDDMGGGLYFYSYYLNGVEHPEYFEGLTMIDIAVMLEQGVFIDFITDSMTTQLWRVTDMRDDGTGKDYYVATDGFDVVPDNGSSARTERQAYILERKGYVSVALDAPSSQLSYEELVALVTNPPQDPSVWYIDQLREVGNYLTWDDFYSSGGRLLIEDVTSRARKLAVRRAAQPTAAD